jgi:imidazolonepropionase-like amidohydrolase|tara:strand:+ start:5881 stop:7128 length:1248 start_codon:yes stop_codon:yes gene_type:complete
MSSIVFSGKRMIDTVNGKVIDKDISILVENEIITAIDSTEKISNHPAFSNSEKIKLAGTILPGLVDCHVHLIGFGDGTPGDVLVKTDDNLLAINGAQNAIRHLDSGVTTLRDLGSKNMTGYMIKEAAKRGIIQTPDLIMSGRPITIVGGHLNWFGEVATGPTECIASVRRLLKDGSDMIKITATGGSTGTSNVRVPSFNLDEMKAIVEEAHKFGVHTAAHCVNTEGMRNAVEAGVDTIIHGRFINTDGELEFDEKLADQMVEKGIFINPTLHQGRDRIWQLLEKEEELTDIEKTEIEIWDKQWDASQKIWEKVLDKGIQFVAGSDASWQYYKLGGTSFQDEIHSHVSVGMSPMAAIQSGTIFSAQSCWVEDEVGSLEVGKIANIISVQGEPEKNITDLRNVKSIIHRGRVHKLLD